jgi:pyruvate/2-oxoglutarate dehydrogenase complex dihydrolipoamide dehydrogenase (E3) component
MKFDAIIIGTGQAGVPLSVALGDHGWKVAIIEKANLGGSCINTGCTPTKTMVARAQVAHYARDAARWGVVARDVSVDLPKIVGQKDRLVESRRQGIQTRLDKSPNVRLFHGDAQFVGDHTVQVGAEVLEGERIFINTGGRPIIPTIPGIEASGYLTNTTMLDLKTLPEHLIVLGGGYVGLEFGQMFSRFGSQVTIIQTGPQIIPREDPEVSGELQRALQSEGIRFLLDARTTKIEKKDGKIVLSVEMGGETSTIIGSHLLVATGRGPNTADLHLERAGGKGGVATGEHGFIQVNGKLETNVPGIWALGDVKGGPAFTHIAYNDYQIVYANLIEGKNQTIDHRIVPYCVFTDPQLGGVGLTEKEARAKGYKLKIGTVLMSRVARAYERDETAGLMKVVVDATNDRILGATILGIEGGEVVHILYTLMLGDLPYTLMKGAVYIHPTVAEGLFFLLEAVKPAD